MTIRELAVPPTTTGDDRATEMIRVWLAHQDLHVSLMLGMWEDADDSNVDEKAAWGELLSDVIKHIANGLNDSHGWDKVQTATQIRDHLLENLKNERGVVTGKYVDD